jgi:hypothetical protein
MSCVWPCQRHGLAFTVQEMPFASQEEVINWMIATQLGRRNLTREQKSYLRGKRYNLEKKKEGAPPGNQNATNQRAENRHIDSERTSERLADEYNVAPSTIRADAEFANAVDILEDQVRADIRETVLKRQFAQMLHGLCALALLAKAAFFGGPTGFLLFSFAVLLIEPGEELLFVDVEGLARSD